MNIVPLKVFIYNCSVKLFLDCRNKFLMRYNPRKIIDKYWRKDFDYPIDWNSPRDINEKIQWLQVNTDTSAWSLLADKVKVRDYVANRGLANILVPLYGVYKRIKDIQFDSLPDRFVLKCNHDSGSVQVVYKLSDNYAPEEIRNKLSNCLKRDVLGIKGEIHYHKIRPRLIIAEQYLGAVTDYKVWCFGGEPYCILACADRTSSSVALMVYDLDWKARPDVMAEDGIHKVGSTDLPKPVSFGKMLEAASILAEGFPQVRVDFYDVNGTLYFGEMTFTSMCGRMRYFTPEFLKELGNKTRI